MANDVPTADWPTLLRELPIAIQQLASHDAHCSLEAAALLRAALGLLNAPGRPAETAYGIIIDTIGRLASLSDRHRGWLSARALACLDRVDDACARYTVGAEEAA